MGKLCWISPWAFTIYDGGRRSLPMYEVRCTMYDCQVRARCAEEAEQERTGYPGTVIGRGYKGAEADGGRQSLPTYDVRCTTEAADAAYARCTKYDVRLPSSRALRGGR